MQIIVNNNFEQRFIEVSPKATVFDLNNTISALFNNAASEQRLVFGGRQLDLSKNVSDYNISDLCTISIIMKLLGGKKKKKKNYTTPKKVKVPHTDIKKILVSQFQVKKDGTVTQSRSDCSTCGVGFFMGVSKQLSFCGNCHLKVKAV